MSLLNYKKYLGFFLLFFTPLAVAKYQVCSITINSSDEIEVFREFLPANDFSFVELLPSQVNEKQDHSSHWFNSACEKNYKCDILVISGHFGGTFFGESGYTLPTELLEEKACQKNCPGILSQVKEIFLFGCNTLADKSKDNRTYTEYLQVLLDDGMARETAERVVAARYSPLEPSFHARMNFIFSGSHTVYGFDQLSPLGRYLRDPLSNYFRSINQSFGSYANYLKTGQHKRETNSELFQYFPRSIFTLNQARIFLSNENPKKRKFFNDKCLLYDDTKNFNLRIKALEDIFQSEQAGDAFFAIDHFLNNNEQALKEGTGRQTFRFIKENQSFSDKFLSYYKHLNFLPYIRIVYLNVLKQFQWINPVELHTLKKQDLLELIKKPDLESYVSLLLLLREDQIESEQFYISKEDLPQDYIQNIWGLLIFEKLKAIAPEWQTDILDYCKSIIEENPAFCYQALNTLAHIQPNLETAQSAVEFLSSKDNGLIFYTIRMLGQSETEDYFAQKSISSFLTHSDSGIREEALEALGFLRTAYADIQTSIVNLLAQADSNQAEEIFWSLNRMDIKSTVAQKTILQHVLNNKNNTELVKKVFSTLQNTSQFSDFTLSFFYSHLESRDDLNFLLSVVEFLSQNKHLKNLGIHYRFLQFQREKTELKQKVLEKMSTLEWLHPEVQIAFLNYAIDENPDIRRLAVNILRNINNLQDKTLAQIKTLHREKKIKELEVFL